MNDYFNKLWVEKYRPATLQDLVLSKENREYFSHVTETIPHLLFCSPPGQGKTTLAKILVHQLKCQYIYINASDENGIDNIRNKVITFAQTRSLDGKVKIIILDEADNLSGDAQRILRNVMEEYEATTRFILTANYFHRICEPLRSRCQIFDLSVDLFSYTSRLVYILKQENISNIPENLNSFIKKCYPDFRRAINDLQKCSVTGELKLSSSDANIVSEYLLTNILQGTDSLQLRRYIISNESLFNADYQHLLQSLFNTVFDSKCRDNQKKLFLTHIAEFMYRDNQVLDHEINFFHCILHLETIKQ